jgi:hypothetical protein
LTNILIELDLTGWFYAHNIKTIGHIHPLKKNLGHIINIDFEATPNPVMSFIRLSSPGFSCPKVLGYPVLLMVTAKIEPVAYY